MLDMATSAVCFITDMPIVGEMPHPLTTTGRHRDARLLHPDGKEVMHDISMTEICCPM